MLLCPGVLHFREDEAQVVGLRKYFLPEDICDFPEFPDERVAITVVLREHEADVSLPESPERAYDNMDVQEEVVPIIIEPWVIFVVPGMSIIIVSYSSEGDMFG